MVQHSWPYSAHSSYEGQAHFTCPPKLYAKEETSAIAATDDYKMKRLAEQFRHADRQQCLFFYANLEPMFSGYDQDGNERGVITVR